jgi:hypothetical protein
MWTCPHCDRRFGVRRAHECMPGMPIALWLDERTDPQRRAAEAVLAAAKRFRGVIVEAVGVGVFLKRERTLVELRPKTKWLDCSFITSKAIASERIARTYALARGTAYVVRLRDERDVDAELKRWLALSLR